MDPLSTQQPNLSNFHRETLVTSHRPPTPTRDGNRSGLGQVEKNPTHEKID
jgi:hypothetical protein